MHHESITKWRLAGSRSGRSGGTPAAGGGLVRCGRLGLDSVALVPTPSSFPRADGRWSFPDARSHCPDFLAHQAAHTQMQSAREGGGQPPHVAPLLAPPMAAGIHARGGILAGGCDPNHYLGMQTWPRVREYQWHDVLGIGRLVRRVV
jgi:hypothetical protein